MRSNQLSYLAKCALMLTLAVSILTSAQAERQDQLSYLAKCALMLTLAVSILTSAQAKRQDQLSYLAKCAQKSNYCPFCGCKYNQFVTNSQ